MVAENVSVRLAQRTVVAQASLSLDRGELVALVGPNGAGKTTLMRALAGLLPAQGAIAFDGKPIDVIGPRERARLVAYLPQGHLFHWPMPVASIVALGREPHSDPFARRTAQDRAAVARALAATGTEAFAARPVTTLSGGERARVALARALATEAPLLFADEPTAALDPRHQLVVMGLLREAAHGGNAVLAILHDLTLAARFADRVVVMERGRLVADGAPDMALAGERVAAVFGVEIASVEIDGARVPLLHRPL
ncbi:MAG: ABC transporter ATP-binding protein [Xanthobacteraceae bacterium]|nr:ABC transporter ATP-binding protein [Xanthobacteraceae bacterium]PWB63446.1 MAG: ABC transporter [Bradyrhizobiaceae bacterium]